MQGAEDPWPARIGHLMFNNPAKLNAVSLDMWNAFAGILADDEKDPAIRRVVVSGPGGKAFAVQRGYDPRDFVLVAFGGAGPLHANALARELAIRCSWSTCGSPRSG